MAAALPVVQAAVRLAAHVLADDPAQLPGPLLGRCVARVATFTADVPRYACAAGADGATVALGDRRGRVSLLRLEAPQP